MKGEAEAFAIEAKAKAEAEQMAKKADAWKDYQEAAMVDMVLETLPKVYSRAALCMCTVYSLVLTWDISVNKRITFLKGLRRKSKNKTDFRLRHRKDVISLLKSLV